MRRRTRVDLILPAMAALVLLADQVSKHLVRTWLAQGQSLDIAPWLMPLFRVTHVTNTGVAFGLFPKVGDLSIIVAVVVVVVIFLYHRHIPREQWLMRVAMGLQLGGALGNLIDRLRHGFVVDFIDVNFWPVHNFAIFNVADSSIVVGVAVLAVLMVWDERLQQNERPLAESS